MKKVLTAGFIIFFLLILIGLILIKVISPQKKSVAENPQYKGSGTVLPVSVNQQDHASFIASCYREYVKAVLVHDDLIPTQAVLNNNATCFAEDYMSNWGLIAEDSQIDPVTFSQDVKPEWNNQINVEMLSRNSGVDTYRVTLGSGTNVHVIYAALVTDNGKPKITMVSDSDYWNKK